MAGIENVGGPFAQGHLTIACHCVTGLTTIVAGIEIAAKSFTDGHLNIA